MGFDSRMLPELLPNGIVFGLLRRNPALQQRMPDLALTELSTRQNLANSVVPAGDCQSLHSQTKYLPNSARKST